MLSRDPRESRFVILVQMLVQTTELLIEPRDFRMFGQIHPPHLVRIEAREKVTSLLHRLTNLVQSSSQRTRTNCRNVALLNAPPNEMFHVWLTWFDQKR